MAEIALAVAAAIAAGFSLRVVWLCSKLQALQSGSTNGWFGWDAPAAEPLSPAQKKDVERAIRELN